MNTNDMEWTRSSYDTTLMHCSGADLPLRLWFGRVGSLMDTLKGLSEFRIHDNGFPGVLVIEGVKGTYKGHKFSIWSDIPGEILLRHPDVPRSAVESLCGRIKECWLSPGGE